MCDTTEEQRKLESWLKRLKIKSDIKWEDEVEVANQIVKCDGNSKNTPKVELKNDKKTNQFIKHKETCGPVAKVEW